MSARREGALAGASRSGRRSATAGMPMPSAAIARAPGIDRAEEHLLQLEYRQAVRRPSPDVRHPRRHRLERKERSADHDQRKHDHRGQQLAAARAGRDELDGHQVDTGSRRPRTTPRGAPAARARAARRTPRRRARARTDVATAMMTTPAAILPARNALAPCGALSVRRSVPLIFSIQMSLLMPCAVNISAMNSRPGRKIAPKLKARRLRRPCSASSVMTGGTSVRLQRSAAAG